MNVSLRLLNSWASNASQFASCYVELQLKTDKVKSSHHTFVRNFAKCWPITSSHLVSVATLPCAVLTKKASDNLKHYSQVIQRHILTHKQTASTKHVLLVSYNACHLTVIPSQSQWKWMTFVLSPFSCKKYFKTLFLFGWFQRQCCYICKWLPSDVIVMTLTADIHN